MRLSTHWAFNLSNDWRKPTHLEIPPPSMGFETFVSCSHPEYSVYVSTGEDSRVNIWVRDEPRKDTVFVFELYQLSKDIHQQWIENPPARLRHILDCRTHFLKNKKVDVLIRDMKNVLSDDILNTLNIQLRFE